MKKYTPRDGERLHRRENTYMKIEQYQSIQGLISICLGGAVFVLLLAMFAVSYVQKGNAGGWIGVAGLLLLAASVVGIVLAFIGLRDPEARKGRPIVGLAVNFVMFIGLMVLYIMGW